MIIGGGPSLMREDVECVRGKARVIGINNAYQICDFLDLLYACDARWWREHHKAVSKLPCRKFSLQVPGTRKPDDVICLRKTGRGGLETDPSGLRHGHNGGFQALNLSFHLGASTVCLLGYDMRLGTGGKSHWHGNHPWTTPSSFNTWIDIYKTIAGPLKAAGVRVINCSRETNLTCFERMPIQEALAAREVAA